MTATSAIVWLVGIALLCFLVALLRRTAELDHRRATLRFDPETGLYHWETEAGTQVSAPEHPDRPGGVWYEAAEEASRDIRS